MPNLFEEVYITQTVWEELSKLTKFHVDPEPIKDAPWISIQSPENSELIHQLRQELDPGEATSIALAVQLNISTILIDEKPGRAIAKQYALTPTGVLGILLRAKRAGYIDLVQPEMDKLIHQAKFYLSDSLYSQILKMAGE